MGNWLFPRPVTRGRGRNTFRGRGGQRGSSRPRPARGGQRGRGARGRPARPSQGMQPARGMAGGSMGERLVNSEALSITTANTLQVFQFTPGKTGLPILDANGDRFTRYRVNYVNIAYLAVDSTTASGVVTWGVAPGAKSNEIKDKATIMTLRPFKTHATWKSESVSVGRGIMPSTWLYCNDETRDGTAFCVYILSTNNTGSFKITYSISLDFPNPQAGSSQSLQSQIESLQQQLEEAQSALGVMSLE